MCCSTVYFFQFVFIQIFAATTVHGISKLNSTIEIKSNNSTDMLSDFYVITTIFNPAAYKSRYTRYYEFAQHMKSSGAQLVTIECIFPTLGQTSFKVTESSNPLHIQLRSKSVYWMKENLINIVVKRLPSNAEWITWIDADIIFHESHWIKKTVEALMRYSVVQMFKYVQFLNAEEEILRLDYSFGYSVVKKKPLLKYDEWYPHPGYGWAMSRSTFDKMGGLPEYGIVGKGDLYFAFTLINQISNVIPEFNKESKFELKMDSDNVYNILKEVSTKESKLIIGFVPVTISHNWHGSKKDRAYIERAKILIAHEFSFSKDMKRQGDGLLQFRNGTESLQKDIIHYFQTRNEDSRSYA